MLRFIIGMVLIIIFYPCIGVEANSLPHDAYAENIAEKINNDVNNTTIDGCNIIGDLTLKDLRGKTIKKKIRITNSTIKGIVDFSGITFAEQIDFSNTIFEKKATFSLSDSKSNYKKGVNFDQAKFLDDATFDGCNFNENGFIASFNNVIFMNSANFGSANFFETADFHGAIFYGNARFHSSKFSGEYIYFNEARFNEYVDFDDANLNLSKETSFYRCVFSQNAYFRGSKFCNSAAGFERTQFLGNANFHGAQFSEKADFSEVQFDGDANFYGAGFKKDADFSNGGFRKDANFGNASFGNTSEFNFARFEGDAIFKEARFDRTKSFDLSGIIIKRFFADWENLRNKVKYNEGAYFILIENYKELGFFHDANECYYDYRTERATKLGIFEKIADKALDLFYGYGIRPLNAILWSLAIVFIFGCYFSNLRGVRHVTREKVKKIVEGDKIIKEITTEIETENIKMDPIEGLRFSVAVFLSGTGKILVDPPKFFEPNEGWKVEWYNAAYDLERTLGLLFIGLFLAAAATTFIIPMLKS